MKNKKFLKLLVFGAMAVCLACMTLSFGASAAGKPEIISQNVKYTDKFSLMYAVDASTVAGGSATLRVYGEYPTNESTPLQTITETATEKVTPAGGSETDCYVFTTAGVAATAFVKNYYVTVTDAEGNVSDVARYSVAEYLNERLYKNGIAAATESDDLARKEFYLSTLAFGANAENVLYNLDDNSENDREYLVTDYKYIYTDLGTIEGFSSGIYAPGTTLTFTPADASRKYQATSILASGADGDGVAIATDGSFTVEANARIDFKKYARGEGEYWNKIGNTLTEGYLAYNFDSEGAALNGFGGNVSGDTTFATGSNIDGAATLTRVANSWATAHFYYNRVNSEFPGDFSDATCKVFEFDYKISNIITNDGRNAFRFDGNDYVKFYKNSDGTTLSLGAKDTAVITPGEWCNIRFEFYNVSGSKYVQIYVNNEYCYTQAISDTEYTYNNRIYFYLEAATSVGTTVCVDNFVMAFVTKDYVANP